MKVVPLRDQIIVKRKAEEKMSSSGLLHIPTTALEKSIEGEVLAVGSGRVLNNGTVLTPEVKVGDKILFHKHGFIEIKLDEEEYLVIREDNVLAVLVED